jgi:predicted Rossmann-fold nucleotide-binding protein
MIISGGQTGVDRAALDVAVEFGLACEGYVPKGRLAEDGPIAERYNGLIETSTSDPAERTEMNVMHSDATLVISRGTLDAGTKLAFR